MCACVQYACLAECFCFGASWHNSFCLSRLCASHSFIQSPEALEKNKEWLEYDQQREAYVKAILARMLWLEKQLNEANQTRSQQHNEDHSDGKPVGSGRSQLGQEGQHTVTTRFLRYQDCPRVTHYHKIRSLRYRIMYFLLYGTFGGI